MYTVFHILYIDVKRLYYLLVYYLEFASFSVLHIFVVNSHNFLIFELYKDHNTIPSVFFMAVHLPDCNSVNHGCALQSN